MKKLLLLSALAFAAMAGTGFAQSSGAFGYGIELTGTGAGALNNGVATLYALDNSGGTRLEPIDANAVTGTLPTLSTAWTSSSTAGTPTFNLGTFTTSQTLFLNGGALLTYKNGGDNVSSADVNYRITLGTTGGTGAYTAVNLAFNEDNVSGNGGDQRWASNTAGINLLQGLAPGTYTLSTYGNATNNESGIFDSNIQGNPGVAQDFGATFTVVVPEPSTWALMLGGLGALVLFQVRRRQQV